MGSTTVHRAFDAEDLRGDDNAALRCGTLVALGLMCEQGRKPRAYAETNRTPARRRATTRARGAAPVSRSARHRGPAGHPGPLRPDRIIRRRQARRLHESAAAVHDTVGDPRRETAPDGRRGDARGIPTGGARTGCRHHQGPAPANALARGSSAARLQAHTQSDFRTVEAMMDDH